MANFHEKIFDVIYDTILNLMDDGEQEALRGFTSPKIERTNI